MLPYIETGQERPIDLHDWRRGMLPGIMKALALLACLYLFVLAITLLGDAFKLLGKDFAETLLNLTAHPVAGLFIGILATSIIQSSSTTTTIIVGMVGGGMLTLECAIPVIMGANIGTTITNTIVSVSHITHRAEYRRAFAGAIVHDIFNLLSVAIFFPLQVMTNFLGHASQAISQTIENAGGLALVSPIKLITKPVISLIIDLLDQKGWLIVILALVLLFVALKYLMKTLKSLVLTRVERFFRRYIFKTTFRALMLGVIITALVQSSSVTTSLIIPLVGAGVLSLRRVYPFTLGANVGTTVTALLAAMVCAQSVALAVALAHLLFNICGIVIFLPLARIPIYLARRASHLINKSRIYPFLFIVLIFFVIPVCLIYLLR